MAEDLDIAEESDTKQIIAASSLPSNLPFIITLAALLVYFAFQTLQLWVERSNYSMVKSNQDAALQEAQKVQAQFKTLITKTNELAEKGHAGARMVMEGLQRQGLGAPMESEPVKPPQTKAVK